MGYTIDIDTGGTFTDGFFTLGNEVRSVKVPTTPHDLTVCFFECLAAGAAKYDVPTEDLLDQTEIIRFSNTIGTNTIIERTGSKVGLLLTQGTEHLAPTAEGDGKAPLVAPDMVRAVNEVVSPDGEMLTAVNEQDVLFAAQELIDQGARCLCIAFTNAPANPANERAAQAAIKREYPRDYLGSVPVFLSSNLSPRAGDGDRINTAVVNAYIHAKLVRLLYKAGEELRQRQYRKTLFIGHNNGTVARVAKTRAIDTYNSGPAAGLLGAKMIGEYYAAENLISADMGGTSFDLGCVRRGEPGYSMNSDLEGFSVNVPMISIRAMGVGGGSIASVQAGKVRVGPQSAGALPGPVAFGLGGTEPTVTDANLALGILDPGYFLGGTMRLDRNASRQAIEEKIARPLEISVEEAALEIKKLADEYMGKGIVDLRTEADLGEDPLLVIYGGAGPAHCCDVARVANLRKVVITPFSAVFSAFGSSTMDVGHIYYKNVCARLSDHQGLSTIARAVFTMKEEASRDIRGEGFTDDDVRMGLELFISGGKNGVEVKVPAPLGFFEDPAAVETVLTQARKLLGRNGGSPRAETVALRTYAQVPHYKIPTMTPGHHGVDRARKGIRPVFLNRDKGEQELAIYDMAVLETGHEIFGPSIVESEHTTVLVRTGWRLHMDHYRNCVIEEVSTP